MSQLRGILSTWRWLLVLGPVFVIAIAFQSLWALRVAGEHERPEEMSVETERLASLIDTYIKRVVGVTGYLTVIPEVVELAEESTKIARTQADEDREKFWTTFASQGKEDPFKEIQENNPLSTYFAELKDASGSAFREIFLSDLKGRVIAASNRTEDYRQDDDPWWPKGLEPKEPEVSSDPNLTEAAKTVAWETAKLAEAARLKKALIRCRHLPMECVHIGGVDWDPSAGLFGYDVVLPVVTADGRAVGVLKAVVDPKELEGLLAFAAHDQDIDTELLDGQGIRVFSQDAFFGKGAVPPLKGLAPGAEASWPLGESRQTSPIAFVRRLSSDVEGGWYIALADRGEKDEAGWRPYLLWCLFTLGMFVVAAGAFAVRRSKATDESHGGEIA